MLSQTPTIKHIAGTVLLAAAFGPFAIAQEPVDPMPVAGLNPHGRQATPVDQPEPHAGGVYGVHCGSACTASPYCACPCPVLGGCAHCPVLCHDWAHRCRDFFPIRKHVQKGPPPYSALPPKPSTFLPVPAAPVYTPMQAQASHLIPTVVPTAPGSYLHLPVGY
ncbi:MAG: hypothetical protein AAGA92_03700 [Planctomycetota bacterium]